MWTINTDGASRGNPGPASVGVVLKKSGETIREFGRALQYPATNNVAEYWGLIWGLEMCRELVGKEPLTVLMDSELIVKQMQGKYRVKHEAMKPLYEKVRLILPLINVVDFVHIPREENKRADELANRALDAAIKQGTIKG